MKDVYYILVERLGVREEDISPESTLEELGADSLDIESIRQDCEVLTGSEIGRFRTVGELISIVEDESYHSNSRK